MGRKRSNVKSVLLAILGIAAIALFYKQMNADKTEAKAPKIIQPTIKFGENLDEYIVKKGVFAENQFLSDLFLANKINYDKINSVVAKCKDIFDVRDFRADKTFYFLSRDTSCTPDYFVYAPSPYKYLKVGFTDSISVNLIKNPIEYTIEEASGVIESSLWNAMVGNGMPIALAAKMEDAYAWAIDFHHILKGDKFKVIYEKEYIDGQSVGVGNILCAYFENMDNGYYAFEFENDVFKGYYDEEGRPMERAFLRAPVKFSRISSGYNKNRLHPILKRRRPHLGTDYAAPRGTPIMAVANGIVQTASFTKNNGNFVKIKHDKTYQTQYLHMQKFASGIRSGVHVKQGQTIGYVGSTGLATGPHVCFRFWKNGAQINHLKLSFPPPAPLPEADMPAFNILRDSLKTQLDAIAYPAITKEEIIAKSSDDSKEKDESGAP